MPFSLKKISAVVLLFVLISLSLLWKVERADKVSVFYPLSKVQTSAQKKAQMMALNFFIPDFSALIAFHKNQQQPSVQQWQTYQDYYQRVIEFVPDLPDGYIMKGLSLYYLGDGAGASDNYKKAIALNPGIFLPYYNLALILLKRGSDEQALFLLTRALKTDPLTNIKHLFSSQVFNQILVSLDEGNKVEYIKNNLEASYRMAYLLSQNSCYKMKACPQPPSQVPAIDKIDLGVF